MDSLYTISGALASLHNLIEAGEATEADIDAAMELESDLDKKVEGAWHVLKNLEPMTDALTAEIDRLVARKKARENSAKRLRNRVAAAMEVADREKVVNPLFTVTLVAGRESLKIDDVDQIPDDLVDAVTEYRPRKDEILERIKAGDEVPGAHVERGDSFVQIR